MYRRFNNLGMGDTTNLHIDLGWSKTNDNLSSIIEALMRDHQRVTTGTGGTDGPPDTATATAIVMASFYKTGLDTDSGGT